MTKNERAVLRRFRTFLVLPNQMLCFNSDDRERFRLAFRTLIERDYLVKEQFKDAYSLTREGFAAMKMDHDEVRV